MRFAFVCLISLISILSCRKEDAVIIKPVSTRDSVFYRLETQSSIGGSTVFYKYDKVGRLILTQSTYGGQTITTTENYEHDRFGNVIHYEEFLSNGETITYNAEYTIDNQLLRSTLERPGIFIYKDDYVFDVQGKEIGHVASFNNSIREQMNYKHDGQGRVIYQEEYYYSQGDTLLLFKHEYHYNTNGQVLSHRLEGVQLNQPYVKVEAWSFLGPQEIAYKETTNGEPGYEKKDYVYDENGNLSKYTSVIRGIDKEYKPYVNYYVTSFTYKRFSFTLPA
jgi:hypothetical protein